MRFFLFLLAQAFLYYIACRLLTRNEEHAPGILRLFLTVLVVVLVGRAFEWTLGHAWLTELLVLLVSFFILWAGLGIGFVRTILAALIVFFLNILFVRVFAHGGFPPYFVSLALFPLCRIKSDKNPTNGFRVASGLQHRGKPDRLRVWAYAG